MGGGRLCHQAGQGPLRTRSHEGVLQNVTIQKISHDSKPIHLSRKNVNIMENIHNFTAFYHTYNTNSSLFARRFPCLQFANSKTPSLGILI